MRRCGRSVDVDVDPDGARIADPTSVSALVSDSDGGEPVSVTLSPLRPAVAVSFPGAALVRAEPAGGCVWHRRGSDAPWAAYTFEAHDSQSGNVVLAGVDAIESLAGSEVLLNPGAILESDRCPT